MPFSNSYVMGYSQQTSQRIRRHPSLRPHQQHGKEIISTFLPFPNLSVLFFYKSLNFFFEPGSVNVISNDWKVQEATSKRYFEGMVIDEFVDIEGGVNIKGVHIINFSVDRRIRRELRE